MLAVTNKFPLIEAFSEKYLKKLINKLIGINDIEDALKRLDRLTQEEARMASAQLMKVTNTINNRVEEIADNMLGVDRIERSWFPNGIHSCWTCRLNYPHRESITTGSS